MAKLTEQAMKTSSASAGGLAEQHRPVDEPEHGAGPHAERGGEPPMLAGHGFERREIDACAEGGVEEDMGEEDAGEAVDREARQAERRTRPSLTRPARP